jgi:4-hydroxy-3-methylbut-2-enyl diphosphate reductase
LFNQCLEVNNHTYLIANASELDKSWIEGKETIGICGATSTPRWLMECVAHRAAELIEENK